VPDPSSFPPRAALEEALGHFHAGRFPEAEGVCRRLVEADPADADALHLLGVLAHHAGGGDAVDLLARAVAAAPGNAEARYNLGVALQARGRADEAAASYREALRLAPGRADAHNNLGHVLLLRGRFDDALACFDHALRLRPDYADAHHNRGETLRRLGKPAAAAAGLREAVRLAPDNASAHIDLGRVLAELRQDGEAEGAYRRALRLAPGRGDAHNHLGLLLLRQRRLDEARGCFEQATRRDPGSADAHNNLGAVLREQGRPDEAVACFHRALALQPAHAGAHNNLGRVCEAGGRLEEAAARYRLAICSQPANAAFHNNLGNALARLSRPEEAIACYREAVRLQPAEPVHPSNLANALTLAGRPEQAEECCRAALRLRPDFVDARHNLAITLAAQGKFAEALEHNAEALRLAPEHAGARNCRALWWLQHGDFARGWPEYEWRWRANGVAPRPFREPAWDGSPLGGRTVLLHAEQALGDTIQFIRYAPLVRRRGGGVVVECQPALARLLESCPGIDRVVPRGSPLPPFDVHAPLLSLPGLLGTTLDTVPAEVPYLSAAPDLVAAWRRELGAGAFKVGVAWQGSPTFAGDRLRSVPLRHFAPLARVPGVRLFGLQKGPGREQIGPAARLVPLTDLGATLDEGTGAFLDTAAVMRNLDLVVTTDTALAHLAGALGVRAWVALSVGPDWRWLLGREDCPWYPSLRLFRQSRPHDWDEVFERMAVELRRELAPPPRNAVAVEVAPGELIDKITILQIKAERLTEPGPLRNVHVELEALRAAQARDVPPSPELAALTAELRAVNEALWQVEDDLRLCERAGNFGPHFVELARSVYRTNDRRSGLKRRINELLGSGLVEEKSYGSLPAAPPSPAAPPRATVCILTYGDHLSYFRRCLGSVLRHTPAGRFELRLGFNAAPASLAHARRCLAADGGEGEDGGPVPPDGVRRASFTAPGGTAVRLWTSDVNLYKEPMARLMFHDVPPAAEYVVWFDDDSFVEEGWWEALCPLLDRRIDYIGQPWWVDYLPGQEEMIRSRPWYRGVPLERRDGRPGVWFMTGGFLAVRAERLREADFPDTATAWKGETLKQYGGDTLLGEVARQLSWTRAAHDTHVRVNVDLEGRHPAPRRGGTGRQFGSDVDVAVG
jgi:tetratricopeptide (TPR) repeat protein